jgi:outer membrane protein OmpA-like peptidoglycan-associated protein
MPHLMSWCSLALLVLFSTKLFSQDTTTLYFETGRSEITEQARQIIDASLYTSQLPINTLTHIYGYADTVGDTEYNNRLSYNRAKNIRQYLVQSGISEKYILTIAGLGEKSSNGSDLHINRRVDIVRGVTVKSSKHGAKALDPKRLRKGETIVLDNIVFFANSSEFKPESFEALDQLVTVLEIYPNLKISLEGHTCCSFNAKDDFQRAFIELSLWRAMAVVRYLKRKGIDEARLSYKGFGGTRPKVHPEISPTDRYRNMRVEIRVLDI